MIPKIALAQIEIEAGRPDRNLRRILEFAARARDSGYELAAFPEMAIPGYLIGDEWENDSFLRDCMACNEELREASRGLTLVWGNVDADWDNGGEDGRTLKFNAAWVARDGRWISNGILEGRTYKTLLPSYREFEDKRHFRPLDRSGLPADRIFAPFPVPAGSGLSQMGLFLCEDMWDADYVLKPGNELEANGAEFLLNISCSPWTWRKNDKRHRVARALVSRASIPLYYVNNTGIQNNGKDVYAFDGGSTVYDRNGDVAALLPPFAEALLGQGDGGPSDGAPAYSEPGDEAATREKDVAEIMSTLLYVLKKFFASIGNPPVPIGLSGGIDSAVNACLLAKALGPDRVWAVNMPSRFNSRTTKDAAADLAGKLGIHYAVIPIQESVDFTVGQVESSSWSDGSRLVLSGLNRENIQARDRGGRILTAIASALNGVFVNNGNKTEIAFGYATLYGDVNGVLSPIGDLYKTQVYELARHINRVYGPLIPQTILDVVPSAELSEAQDVDKGLGDPIIYEYHDRLLYQFVDGGYQENYSPRYGRRDPFDILSWYADGSLEARLSMEPGTLRKYFADSQAFVKDLEEKWTWYKRSIFKRVQAPPIVAISKRAFGFDLRESMNAAHFTKAYYELKARILDRVG